jgi:hypothetical protein
MTMHAHLLLKLGLVTALGVAAYPKGSPPPGNPARVPGAAPLSLASSHREAPAITEIPKLDATDFYLFRSYEPGREGFVTVVACYQPLQAPYGGPNYFTMDPEALYEIHLDNDGDAREDLTFQFRFQNRYQGQALEIGPAGDTKSVPIPLVASGPVSADPAFANLIETFTVDVVSGDRRTGRRQALTNAGGGASEFQKPLDNIGSKTLGDYAAYAADFLYEVDVPGVGASRLFVGQRKDPFVVNLGEVFDLVNLDPVGPPDGEADLLADANVTALVLELPIAGILGKKSAVIGGWTTASLRQGRVLDPRPSGHDRSSVEGGAWVQVSRLSSPLVNELVIGLPDKDRFNASEPREDAQFLTYVTHPTLPALLEALFGVTAPTLFPRQDLVEAFLTGVGGLNQNGSAAEMLRLNTSIAPRPKGTQGRLGALEGDTAGFPNGRRPGDDVVDIELRVAMGVLIADPLLAPSGQLPYTDGALVDDSFFDESFPYLRTPLAGSPNE